MNDENNVVGTIGPDGIVVGTGGGLGGLEQVPMETAQDAPSGTSTGQGEPPYMVDMRNAAARMRDVTMVARELLNSYVTSGGTYTSLNEGHIKQAYDIASAFVVMGEGIWGQLMNGIISAYENPPQEKSLILDQSGNIS